MAATVTDCERVQRQWFTSRAESVWRDGPLPVTDGPDGLNIMFPTTLEPAAIDRTVAAARERGLDIVGAWLSAEVDPAPLAAAGFERGWDPWWMTRSLAGFAAAPDPRVELRAESAGTFAAQAHVGERHAGQAWSHLAGAVAGVFDMAVWEPFRRRGIGSALLSAVLDAAAGAGAGDAVLNATEEGALLYATAGFVRIGDGRTWWLHF